MWNSYQQTVDFVHLDNKMDEDVVNGNTAMTWESIVGLLSHHDVRPDKDGPAYMPVKLKPQDEWIKGQSRRNDGEIKESYRVDENIEAISFAVLDLDTPSALAQAREVFKDFEYVVHSTHSYNKDAPYKCRIALKLEEPILVKDWNEFTFSIAKSVEIDENCKNFSRLFYLPSIAPDAGLKPISEYQGGRAITLSDAKSIGALNARGLDDEQLEALKQRYGFSERSQEKRHFSGESIPLYKRNQGKTDYSFEGISNRHKEFINTLNTEDSRHKFALQVLGREVAILGDRVDVDKIIAFMYRASLTNGSKPLTSGDTPKEISKIFMGAYEKFARGVGEDNPEFLRELPARIDSAMAKAEASMVTNNWDFATTTQSQNVKANISYASLDTFDPANYSYSAMRTRNKQLINYLLRENDFAGFALDVFESEISKGKDNTNLNAVGQFVFYCLASLVKHRNLNIKEFESEIKCLIDNDLDISVDAYLSEKEKERFPRFIKTSIKLGNHALNQRIKWNFPKEPERSAAVNP
ncbi:hypothetical protein [Vibrio owensii]|uniref:hypothetical protein n=1 Tax=Vibrio owensii TaxID=696485 RepID=UPI003CC5573E